MNARAFGVLRRRFIPGLLEPQGFELENREFVARKNHEQLWFLRSIYPGVKDHYAIEVGVHFAFVAPFRFTQWPGANPATAHGVDGSFLNSRVQDKAGNHIFSHEAEKLETEQQLGVAVSTACELLKAAGETIEEGSRLLELIPPETLRADLDKLPYQTHIWRVFPGWQPNAAAIGLMLCHICRYLGKQARFREYLEAMSDAKSFLVPNWKWFEDDVRAVSAGAA